MDPINKLFLNVETTLLNYDSYKIDHIILFF